MSHPAPEAPSERNPMNVALIAAVSADGKIAGSETQVSLDWTSREDTAFFVSRSRELGAVVMGRKTWETIGRPLPGRLVVVMTRRPVPEAGIPGRVEFTDRPPAEILRDLSRRGFSGVALAGGAEINGLFLREGLVTDVFLTVEPLLFGRGVDLARGVGTVRLRLVEVRRLGRETVLLHYRPSPPNPASRG